MRLRSAPANDHFFRLVPVIVLSLILCAESSFAAEAQKKTTLRVGEPKGIWRTSAGTLKLVQADLQVKNVGDYPAEDLKVAVIVPGGQRIELSGPENLGANKSANFSSGSIYEFITRQGKLKADVHCANCN